MKFRIRKYWSLNTLSSPGVTPYSWRRFCIFSRRRRRRSIPISSSVRMRDDRISSKSRSRSSYSNSERNGSKRRYSGWLVLWFWPMITTDLPSSTQYRVTSRYPSGTTACTRAPSFLGSYSRTDRPCSFFVSRAGRASFGRAVSISSFPATGFNRSFSAFRLGTWMATKPIPPPGSRRASFHGVVFLYRYINPRFPARDRGVFSADPLFLSGSRWIFPGVVPGAPTET